MTRSTIRTWRHGSAALASPQNPTAPVDMARTLEMLAVRVGQLSPSWRSPEHFAAERSEWDPETLREQPYDVEKTLRLFEEANRQ